LVGFASKAVVVDFGVRAIAAKHTTIRAPAPVWIELGSNHREVSGSARRSGSDQAHNPETDDRQQQGHPG